MDVLQKYTVPCGVWWLAGGCAGEAARAAGEYAVRRGRLLSVACDVTMDHCVVIDSACGADIADTLAAVANSTATHGPLRGAALEAEGASAALARLRRAITTDTPVVHHVTWTWPCSVLGTNEVASMWIESDAVHIGALLACVRMREGDAEGGASAWREVGLLQEQWAPYVRSFPAMPGWHPRLAPPEQNANVVAAMAHLCACARVLGRDALDVDDTAHTLLRSHTVQGPRASDAPAAARALGTLWRVWYALAHARAALVNIGASLGGGVYRTNGSRLVTCEYNAGVRPGIVAHARALHAGLCACAHILGSVCVAKIHHRSRAAMRMAADAQYWVDTHSAWRAAIDAAAPGGSTASLLAEDGRTVACGAPGVTYSAAACATVHQNLSAANDAVEGAMRTVRGTTHKSEGACDAEDADALGALADAVLSAAAAAGETRVGVDVMLSAMEGYKARTVYPVTHTRRVHGY